jgi:hypothetical protein
VSHISVLCYYLGLRRLRKNIFEMVRMDALAAGIGQHVEARGRRLGHGSPAITLNVYGHLFKPDDRAAAIMEAALTDASH